AKGTKSLRRGNAEFHRGTKPGDGGVQIFESGAVLFEGVQLLGGCQPTGGVHGVSSVLLSVRTTCLRRRARVDRGLCRISPIVQVRCLGCYSSRRLKDAKKWFTRFRLPALGPVQ